MFKPIKKRGNSKCHDCNMTQNKEKKGQGHVYHCVASVLVCNLALSC